MDQGLFALSNFALNILLARWLAPNDYGAFAIAYSIFLLLGTFHTAVITEPMLVFGSSKYKDRFRSYVRVLLRGHWTFCSLVGTLFVLTALALWHFGDSPLHRPILGLAIASPLILFQWLMRRACYVNLHPQLAVYSGVLYLVIMLTGAYALYRYAWLNAATALGLMAVGSLVSGVWLVYLLQVNSAEAGPKELEKETLTDHWRYGRWAVGISAVSWVRNNVYILLLPMWEGFEAAGVFRALMNFIMPIEHVSTAISILMLSALAAARGTKQFWYIFFLALHIIIACSVFYWMLLVEYSQPLMNLFYANQYSAYTPLLPIVGVIPLLSSMTTLAARSLQALERLNKIFIADFFSMLFSLFVGVVLLITYGITGTFVAIIFGLIVALILMGGPLAYEFKSC